MLHAYLGDAKFWQILVRFDEDLAAQARRDGCAFCGGVLHGARYSRKPRGVVRAVLGADYEYRLSLCCAREGCRRRTTPASVRFLGRRVYLGALVVLVGALSQGLRGRRLSALCERFAISVRTVRRWRQWWREVFPDSALWRGARGDFVSPLTALELPAGLLARLGGEGAEQGLLATLKFVAPVSLG